jgi:phage terminase small subunit
VGIKEVDNRIIVMAERLTGKQQRFVEEYIVCLNATEACRRAGYAGEDNVLAVLGSKMVRNGKILAAIDDQLNAFAMPASEVLTHLTDIARGDVADVLNGVGGIDPLEAVRRGKSHMIKKFKTKTITTIGKGKDDDDVEVFEAEIEMYDRLKALELLAKYHDLINKIRIDDWRTQAIADIRSGNLPFEALADAFDKDLASELFRAAGVPISTE